MSRTQNTRRFVSGEKFSLDDIYDIQALGGGDWWEKTGDDDPEHRYDIDMSEALRCTRDIKITIIIETPNVKLSGP